MKDRPGFRGTVGGLLGRLRLEDRRVQLGAAGGLGVLAVVLLHLYAAGVRREARAGLDPVEILVARRSIPPNTPIREEHLAAEWVPRRWAHRNALTPKDRDMTLGQKALYGIEGGQPILWQDLGVDAAGSAGGGLAEVVRERERAISIPVDEVSSVSNLVRPNDHVDILGTFSASGGEVTLTLLQNVTVIAVGGRYGSGGGGGYGTVSVSVTPQEAALLTLAQGKGRITLSLRNGRNLESVGDLPRAAMEDILKTETRRSLQAVRDVRVIQGKQ